MKGEDVTTSLWNAETETYGQDVAEYKAEDGRQKINFAQITEVIKLATFLFKIKSKL